MCFNMEEIIKLDTVGLYNKLYGVETLHPLVSVVDASEIKQDLPANVTLNYGLYALYLKQTKCGDLRYGRQLYDYQEGTVTSFAPGQVVEVRRDTNVRPQWQGLVFHPDLIRGTSLGQDIKQYSFFSYASNEALHLSDEEKSIYRDCLEKIKMELARPVDKHSRRLIVRNIELLLDYCMRFYERQFVTRSKVNKDILVRFEEQLDAYFQGGASAVGGAAYREIFCGSDEPVAQLFRRPCQERNRAYGARVHPRQTDRSGQAGDSRFEP